MYRTSEEESEYQALSANDKKRYNLEAELNPSLSHKKIMQIVAIKIVLPPGDVDINNLGTRKTILERLDDWLFYNARSVWRSVTSIIRDAINYLGDLIVRAGTWIGDNIIDPVVDFLDDLFG